MKSNSPTVSTARRGSWRIRGAALWCGALLLAGCAAPGYLERVEPMARQYGVAEAEAMPVAGRGHLRFDTALRSDLDDAVAATDVALVHERGAEVLRHATNLAVASSDLEIDRLPEAGLRELAAKTSGLDAAAGADDLRRELKARFAGEANQALAANLQQLGSATQLAEARAFLEAIRRDIAAPAGDRGKLGRALLGAPLFVPATIGAEIADTEATQRSFTADFAEVVEYRPPAANAPTNLADLEALPVEALARRYAPVFVQQRHAAAPYAAQDDEVGRVFLTGTPRQVEVNVDTTRPVVYWSHSSAKVHDLRHDQLVYTAWYPRRPALEPNDPSAGRIDGVVVRITLDRHHRPAIYEFVRSCGCYHTLWVAEYVEAEARREYGAPPRDCRFAVQTSSAPRELFLPDLVPDDGSAPERPHIYVTAGHHLVVRIAPHVPAAATSGAGVREYQLEPYANLTRLPLGDGVASMFGSDGLVHDAGRREGWLLSPTGMLSAGQPRQLGTMKIRMDAYDYEDPRLLERNLRLPHAF